MPNASRIAVVTGASAGIGHAVALELASRGYDVALIARSGQRLEEVRAEVEGVGRNGMSLVADVADAAAVKQAIDTVVERWGSVDLLVSNAMVTVFSPLAQILPDEFARVTQVTYLGAVHATMAALPHMRERGGTVLYVSSALAYRGIPLQSAYCGAKFALRGFVDSLRVELLHEGAPIRLVTAYLPGVNTPQFDWARNKLPKRPQPVGNVFQPEAVARAIVDAAEAGTPESWIGGPTAKLAIGDALAPEIVDHQLEKKAISGQQSHEPAVVGAADNLFDPAPGPARSRGRFDERAHDRVSQINPRSLRNAFALIAGATLIAMFARSHARE